MEPTTLAASIVAALAPFLATASQEFAKEAGKTAATKIGPLYNFLKTRFGKKPAANKALTALKSKPRDKKVQKALERQLRNEMKNDKDLTVTLEKLLAEIQDDKNLATFINQFQGAQIGKVIQMRDVDNLTIN